VLGKNRAMQKNPSADPYLLYHMSCIISKGGEALHQAIPTCTFTKGGKDLMRTTLVDSGPGPLRITRTRASRISNTILITKRNKKD